MASDEHVIGPVAARLSDAQIDLLRRHGQERATTQGEVLFREGDRGYDFLVILARTVVAVDGYGGAQRELAVGFPGDFAAELNLHRQMGTTSRIENYLGFPVGISGSEFATRAVVQAQRFGTTLIVPGRAVGHREQDGFQLVTVQDGAELSGRSVIMATGVQYRRLEVPRIDRFEGTAVFYTPLAAVEQLGAGDPVIIVGDGNSAGQAATSLAGSGHRVTMIVRGPGLSQTMSAYLIERIGAAGNVEVLAQSEVVELDGDAGPQTALVEDHRTGLRRRVEAAAMFVLIGAEPHTAWLAGSVQLDDAGFILTGDRAAQAYVTPGRGGRSAAASTRSRRASPACSRPATCGRIRSTGSAPRSGTARWPHAWSTNGSAARAPSRRHARDRRPVRTPRNSCRYKRGCSWSSPRHHLRSTVCTV